MEKKNNLQMYLHPAATHGHGGSRQQQASQHKEHPNSPTS